MIPRDAHEVPRVHIEAVARIVGDLSAAAQALRDADTHDGEVHFYVSGTTIIVEKKPKEG